MKKLYQKVLYKALIHIMNCSYSNLNTAYSYRLPMYIVFSYRINFIRDRYSQLCIATNLYCKLNKESKQHSYLHQ